MTYVVPPRGNEVEGEGYDYIGRRRKRLKKKRNTTRKNMSYLILSVSLIYQKYQNQDIQFGMRLHRYL